MRVCILLALLIPALPACSTEAEPGAASNQSDVPEDARPLLEGLASLDAPSAATDTSNRYADDPKAAALGKKFFFETRFSGPLLVSEHSGAPFGQSLGKVGEAGRVGCVSCHDPSAGFLDSRTDGSQVSLGAGWTHRRAPSLLGVGHRKLLMWDGRRDAAYNQILGPLESAVEMNSSRLFLAQQVIALYRDEYEAVFPEYPLPDLSKFAALAPEDAGCSALPAPAGEPGCGKPYDDEINRVVVNVGKAISAYLRQMSCGSGRFDDWVLRNDVAALTDAEKRGALLFVGKAGCNSCHSGPQLTNEGFYNVGLPPATVAVVISVGNDPGAAEGIPAALKDPLNVRGPFSDGDDGRLDAFEGGATQSMLGAFKVPSLRCVSERSTFMHTGQARSLRDAVRFFNRGGGSDGSFLGEKQIAPLGLSDDEIDDLVAFLGTLSGPGPDAQLLVPPTLP